LQTKGRSWRWNLPRPWSWMGEQRVQVNWVRWGTCLELVGVTSELVPLGGLVLDSRRLVVLLDC